MASSGAKQTPRACFVLKRTLGFVGEVREPLRTEITSANRRVLSPDCLLSRESIGADPRINAEADPLGTRRAAF